MLVHSLTCCIKGILRGNRSIWIIAAAVTRCKDLGNGDRNIVLLASETRWRLLRRESSSFVCSEPLIAEGTVVGFVLGVEVGLFGEAICRSAQARHDTILQIHLQAVGDLIEIHIVREAIRVGDHDVRVPDGDVVHRDFIRFDSCNRAALVRCVPLNLVGVGPVDQ